MAVNELYLEDALAFVRERKTRFVWLGNEPVEYIQDLLHLAPDLMVYINPNTVLHAERQEAETYRDCIFVCYHGVTSKYLAEMLADTYKIESGSLKGGVTAIVGEIF